MGNDKLVVEFLVEKFQDNCVCLQENKDHGFVLRIRSSRRDFGVRVANLEEPAVKWGFKGELNTLAKTASVIREVLRDAEDERNSNNRQVTLWLRELKGVLYDVEDLLDDVSTDSLQRKIVSGDGMAKVLIEPSSSSVTSYHPVEPPLEVRERERTYSFVRSEDIIGRNDDKRKIVQLMLESEPEQNVSLVPIIGIGGLGMTTLTKMVFSDGELREQFELKMWNYLLVLDDVWNEDLNQWRRLWDLISGGARESWIVITARSGLVADITGTVSPHHLRGLSKREFWSLLKQTALKEASRESNNPRIEAIGMEIVDKCKGVPLALRAIGKIIYNRTEAEWVRVKNNPLNGDEDLKDVGKEYFKDLIWRSFLECSSLEYAGESEFPIRMHDLACSVARESSVQKQKM
ncbi:putative disease resistance protein RGA1 [Hibiscus syriacus]|uniref:putative disease resistance protein RGA1 n=1 Tax=Hibiscus syriacus TaxID=106335 RepID=UPI0019229B62|nr:putative disease resistance protein RGA1 [Hibiscus syriacus]